MKLSEVSDALGLPASNWGNVRTWASIVNEVDVAGPGTRGIVYGGRGPVSNPGMGHFFNVMNQGGNVVFLDGQSGQVVDYSGTFNWFALLRTR